MHNSTSLHDGLQAGAVLSERLKIGELAHIRKPDTGGVDETTAVGALSGDRRRDLALQLAAHAFGAQHAEIANGLHGEVKIFAAAKGGGILLNIRRDHTLGLADELLKAAAFEIATDELIEQFVIASVDGVVLHEMVIERALAHDLTAGRGVDGIIHIEGAVVHGIWHAEGIGGEGEVVVPGQDLQDAVFFIEKIIVPGATKIAVEIDDENLHGEISQHFIDVDGGFEIVATVEDLERGDQARLVGIAHVELGVAENILIPRRVVACVAQMDVGVVVGQALVIRLIKFSVITAVDAAREGLLRLLDGEKKSPGLAVHRHPGVARQRRRHVHEAHHVEGKPVFHVGVVLKGRIKGKFVEPVIILRSEMVELDLQTVALVAVVLGEAQRIVALSAQADVVDAFAVDDEVGGPVLLLWRCGEKRLPVVDLDVDGVHARGVEQPRGVARLCRRRREPKALAVHKCERHQHRDADNGETEPVDVLALQHRITPCNRRCRKRALCA